MYKILCDGKLMCDSRIEELALVNPVVKLEENKAGSFSFTIVPSHPFYDSIQKRKSILEIYQDSELLFCGVCTEESKDFYKQKTIYCEGELSYLNDSIQRPASYHNATVRGLLEAYIANHNAQVEESKRFEVGMVTVTDANDSLYCYTNMENTMQCIKEDLVDDLGGYLRVRYKDGIKYIDYLADSMNTNSQIIKLGKNLLDFTSNIDSSEIATAIIPLGAKLEESPVEGLEVRLTIESANNGKDYVYSPDAVNSFGWIYKTVTWDDVTTASALKTKGEKYLSDIQYENMVIEAKAVDLHLTNEQIEKFRLSDQIRVLSAPHGLDRYFRLTKMTINLNNPENNTITLGKEEIVSLSARSNQENAEIKRRIDEIVPPSEVVKQAVENASALIANAMGGYVVKTNDELLIMDTDNTETATKVWRWNINGLGYSSTGYNGEYGLAMTMDGRIVANFITAGTMYADRIKGGSLKLGGHDNTNGVLIMLNSEGVEVGRIDQNGITLPAGTKIAWSDVTGTDSVAKTEDIPSNVSQLNNDSGYETATSIKNTVITKDYIETLKVKAGSVDAESITGETITGKTLQGAKGYFEKLVLNKGVNLVFINSNGEEINAMYMDGDILQHTTRVYLYGNTVLRNEAYLQIGGNTDEHSFTGQDVGFLQFADGQVVLRTSKDTIPIVLAAQDVHFNNIARDGYVPVYASAFNAVDEYGDYIDLLAKINELQAQIDELKGE